MICILTSKLVQEVVCLLACLGMGGGELCQSEGQGQGSDLGSSRQVEVRAGKFLLWRPRGAKLGSSVLIRPLSQLTHGRPQKPGQLSAKQGLWLCPHGHWNL